MKLSYETRLESAESKEIVPILDAKLSAASPQGVADYISFACDNLSDRLDRIKKAEAELKALKASTQAQIDTIKEGSALWLEESGIDKLNGDIVSSISVRQPDAKVDLIVDNKEALINGGYFKTVLDKTAVKKALMADEKVEGAHVEITHVEPTVRINKKRS